MDSVLSLKWLSGSVETPAVLSFDVQSDYMVSTDGWTADIAVTRGVTPEALFMNSVDLAINGTTIMHARCEWVETGRQPGLMTIGGRDYLADSVVSDIDPKLSLKDGDALDAAILKALSPFGIQQVTSDGGFELRRLRTGLGIGRKRTAVAPGEMKLTDLKPEPGRKAYEYVSNILARHGLTLQPGSRREEVLLSDPDYEQPPMGQIRRKPDGVSHVLQAAARRDGQTLLTTLLMSGMGGKESEKRAPLRRQWNASAVASAWSSELSKSFGGFAVADRREPGAGALTDSQLYRFAYHHDEMARTQAQLNKAATRIVADKLRQTLAYKCTLLGLSPPGSTGLYAPDTILSVDDDDNFIHENLWVASRRFSGSPSGVVTTLELWRPGSFVIG